MKRGSTDGPNTPGPMHDVVVEVRGTRKVRLEGSRSAVGRGLRRSSAVAPGVCRVV